MYNARKMQGKGIKMDVMDYICNEMWIFTMEKKVPTFAPYIMQLIEDTWLATKNTALSASVPVSLIPQEKKKPRVKTHKEPKTAPGDDNEKAPSWAKSLAPRVRKTFCLTMDVHNEQYNAYYDRKKAYKLNKDIARHMKMPVSPAGSEENIKSIGRWKSDHVDEMPYDEDLDGIYTPPLTPTHPDASTSGAGPRADPPGWEGTTWGV